MVHASSCWTGQRGPGCSSKLWQATTPAEAAVSSAWCLRRLAGRKRLCAELLVARAAAFSTLFFRLKTARLN